MITAWASVMYLLYIELGILLLIVLPLPSLILRPIVSLLKILFRPYFFLIGFLVECLLVYQSYEGVQRAIQKEEMLPSHSSMDVRREAQGKRWRAERNLYLTGFSLTLFVVIYRLLSALDDKFKAQEELKKQK